MPKPANTYAQKENKNEFIERHHITKLKTKTIYGCKEIN